MKANVITEEPVFYYRGCCPQFGQEIALYSADLHNSNVGDKWVCEDQDQFPNRQHCWDVCVTVVYKDANGVALVTHSMEINGDPDTITWIQLH